MATPTIQSCPSVRPHVVKNKRYSKRIASKAEFEEELRLALNRVRYLKTRANNYGVLKDSKKKSIKKTQYKEVDKERHFYVFWTQKKGLKKLATAWKNKRKAMVYHAQVFTNFQTRILNAVNKYGTEGEKDFLTELFKTNDNNFQ